MHVWPLLGSMEGECGYIGLLPAVPGLWPTQSDFIPIIFNTSEVLVTATGLQNSLSNYLLDIPSGCFTAYQVLECMFFLFPSHAPPLVFLISKEGLIPIQLLKPGTAYIVLQFVRTLAVCHILSP